MNSSSYSRRSAAIKIALLFALLTFLFSGTVSAGCVKQEGASTTGVSIPSEGKKAPATTANLAAGGVPAGGFADVVAPDLESVVNVFTTKQIKEDDSENNPLNDPLFRKFFGPMQPFHQAPMEQHSLGSGVVIEADGYIVTNNHVVEGVDEVKVLLQNKREYIAKIVGTDPPTDIALLKIEATDLKPIPFGDSDAIRIADIVLAIGNPFGLDHTVTMGIISAKGRSAGRVLHDKDFYGDFLQTDAAINPGNSGGALIDAAGRLVGINSAIYSRSGGNQGVGFAIPVNLAKTVLQALRSEGKVTRGWLGVMIQDIDQDMADAMNLKTLEGALVSDVMKDSPAEKAGILRGDVITALNGKAITNVDQLRNTVSLMKPGTKVTLTVVREGKPASIAVEIGELEKGKAKMKSEAKEGQGEKSRIGIQVADMNENLAQQYEIDPSLRGVVVTAVEPGSKAEKGGLQEGDVILEVNKKPVRSGAEFKKTIASLNEGVLLMLVNRQGSNLFVTIRLK